MKTRIFVILLIIILLQAATACKRNNYIVNVSGIDVTVSIKRLEKDLFTINPNSLRDNSEYLKNRYGEFLRYFSYVINIGEINDSSWNENLLQFCTDKLNNEVYSSTVSVFSDIKYIEEGLTDAFKHYNYYFPNKKVPAVYTFISGFNNSIITGDSTLGIGLDRYLGSGSMYYQQLMMYKYQTAKMNPENILPDCMYGWAASEWDYQSTGYPQDNVLSEMIHDGKLLYFTRCMLPELQDEVIFGFNKNQIEFCKNNEGRIWHYLVENNLIYSTDQLTRKKLTGEAAFTTYFSTESPGRAAVWIGFRIVESYMLKNRQVSLGDLMKETDIQAILEKARYRPPTG